MSWGTPPRPPAESSALCTLAKARGRNLESGTFSSYCERTGRERRRASPRACDLDSREEPGRGSARQGTASPEERRWSGPLVYLFLWLRRPMY